MRKEKLFFIVLAMPQNFALLILVHGPYRRIAMENDISLAEVQGTGREGRVLKEDVLLHLETRKSAPVASTPPLPPPKPQPAKKTPQPLSKPVISVKPSVVAGTEIFYSWVFFTGKLVNFIRKKPLCPEIGRQGKDPNP